MNWICGTMITQMCTWQAQSYCTQFYFTTNVMQYPCSTLICLLLDRCQLLNNTHHSLQTPLHLACITRQPRVAQCLMAAGACPDIQDRNGKTALHLACERGNLDCVRELTKPLVDSRFNEETKERVQSMLNARDYEGMAPKNLPLRNTSSFSQRSH